MPSHPYSDSELGSAVKCTTCVRVPDLSAVLTVWRARTDLYFSSTLLSVLQDLGYHEPEQRNRYFYYNGCCQSVPFQEQSRHVMRSNLPVTNIEIAHHVQLLPQQRTHISIVPHGHVQRLLLCMGCNCLLERQ
jgi:hypothetical protein